MSSNKPDKLVIRLAKTLFLALAALVAAPAGAQDGSAVLPMNFPDPFVLPVQGRYYAYATNSGGVNVPMAFSTGLQTWSPLAVPGNPDAFHDAMPTLPAWVREGRTWAPEVMRVGANYILYFTAHHRARDQQCIGAAVSRDPRGPFVAQGDGPLVCQHDLGGTIDANPFRDADGQLYLYYKNDGNHPSARTATQLWGQRLSPDGLSLVGEAMPLIRNDAGWEGHLIEAPFMVRHGQSYVLFYSANDYAWQPHQRLSLYATGYATCSGPLGPCTKAPGAPMLASARRPLCLSGPGHPAIFEANGRQWIAFHAWATRGSCNRGGDARFLHIAPLDWQGDAPAIGGRRP